jgi:hypothetical protein
MSGVVQTSSRPPAYRVKERAEPAREVLALIAGDQPALSARRDFTRWPFGERRRTTAKAALWLSDG